MQRCQHKANSAQDGVLFHQVLCLNFIAYFRLKFLHQTPHLIAIMATVVTMKSILQLAIPGKTRLEMLLETKTVAYAVFLSLKKVL